MIKKCFDNSKKILLVLSSIIIFFIVYFLIINKPFILGNDQLFQYNIFYREWLRLIKEFLNGNGLPMYSWNMYLGTDFYSSMGYYCTGDVFLPILYLFKNNIELGLIIETILCVYISSFTFNYLLIELKVKNEYSRLLISLIYGIGGMASLYFGNYMFHRFYAFLPLLFIGTLKYFEKKTLSLFILSICVLFLQNYYFMFPTLLFLFLYSITYEIKNNRPFKVVIKDFFVLLFSILVGFCISAVITMPSIMYLINNSRVGLKETGGLLWPLNTYLGLLMTLISFNPVETGFDIFQNIGQAHVYQFTLFITILPLLASIKYFCKKENRVELILMLALLVLLCVKPFSSIMHGFSNPSFRWIFVIQLYILMAAGQSVDELNIKNDKKCFIDYSSLYLICLVLLVVFGYSKGKLQHTILLLMSLIIAFSIVFVYVKNRKLAIILSIIEVVLFQTIYFYLETKGISNYPNSINREEVEYNQSIDEDYLYRYYYSYKNNVPDSILNQNKPLDYGFMSTSTYNSLTDSNVDLFNDLTNASHDLDWVLYVDDPYANTMLGVKYYIVYKEDELPKELEFEYAYNLDYLMVYKNLNYKGFGYTSSKLKYTKDFNDTKDFYDYILVDNETIDISKYKDISEVKLNIDERYKNYFKANIDLDNDNILLIPIPNNKGWNIKVNGEMVTPISVNGGFIGLELNAGHNEIEMNFMSSYFKAGLLMSGFGVICFIVILVIDSRKRYGE